MARNLIQSIWFIDRGESYTTAIFYKAEEERKIGGNKMEYRQVYLKNLKGMELDAEERAVLVSANAAIPTETQNTIFSKIVKENRF